MPRERMAAKSEFLPSAVLRIAAAISPVRNIVVVLCLLGSGAAEDMGIASLIPLIVAAGGEAGKKSEIADYMLGWMRAQTTAIRLKHFVGPTFVAHRAVPQTGELPAVR